MRHLIVSAAIGGNWAIIGGLNHWPLPAILGLAICSYAIVWGFE